MNIYSFLVSTFGSLMTITPSSDSSVPGYSLMLVIANMLDR